MPHPRMPFRLWMVPAILFLWSAAVVHAALAPSAPAPPDTTGRPAAFDSEIGNALKAIRDLRVYLDFDDDTATFACWPVDNFGNRLPADQIARGVRLGLSLWASVLPDMRFRFVNRPEEANVAFRFGPYRNSGVGNGGGRAFPPYHWSELRADCGRFRENRRPGGSPCLEWTSNIIILNRGNWAVTAVDFIGNGAVHEYLAWVYDTGNPHHRVAGGPCRDGGDSMAVWDHTCVPFPRSPHYAQRAGMDLALMVQHEFGHTLMGDHSISPGEYVDHGRKPILDPEKSVRLTPTGYSVMIPGDGTSSLWNCRSVSRFDADRLAALGYRVCYPRVRGRLQLARPDGRILSLTDWREADKAMIWPLQGRPVTGSKARRQYFLVDVRLEDAPGRGP